MSFSKTPLCGLGQFLRVVPGLPTEAQPGSEEKIKVMEQRVARGESVFHPHDRTCFGERGRPKGASRLPSRTRWQWLRWGEHF